MDICTWFNQALSNQKLVAQLKKLKFIVCDVDGSLTNANVYFSLEGEDGREFSVQDGFAMEKSVKGGLLIALMSGKSNKTTMLRGVPLGIPEELCIVGVKHKPSIIKELAQRYNVELEQMAIFGDDFLDAQVKLELSDMMFIAPANAPFYLSAQADLTLPLAGGQSAFRLFLDLLLFVQGKHFAQELIQNCIQPIT
ncbi:hypothetical protein JST56_04475 [Candidatus Dependentiae bacterium]|jgi:YrbI family 3-deoxy-D-manno-octulosonate 8-phosphate phosphatase|nr:hypothetical protein [Candidatus Dependentiae bacterium]